MIWLLGYLIVWFCTAVCAARLIRREDDYFEDYEAVACGLALGAFWPITAMGLLVWHFLRNEESA